MFQDIDRGGLVVDAVAAVPYLAGREETNGKVGAVGFCFGGGIVNLMAVNSPELARRRRLLRRPAAGRGRRRGSRRG